MGAYTSKFHVVQMDMTVFCGVLRTHYMQQIWHVIGDEPLEQSTHRLRKVNKVVVFLDNIVWLINFHELEIPYLVLSKSVGFLRYIALLQFIQAIFKIHCYMSSQCRR